MNRIKRTTPAMFAAVCLAFAEGSVSAKASGQVRPRGAPTGVRTTPTTDTAFAGVQRRGGDARGMRVDQSTSMHQFDALADGGRIELQQRAGSPAEVQRIRQHMREIATAFTAGDFSTPAFVHKQQVPGTGEMAAMRARITYTVRDLPKGAEVRITTRNSDALAAVHEFIAFQRKDHRAGGKGTPKPAHAHGTHKPGGHR